MASKRFNPCRQEVAKKNRKLGKAQASFILHTLSNLDGFENAHMEPDACYFKLCLVPTDLSFSLDILKRPGLMQCAIGCNLVAVSHRWSLDFWSSHNFLGSYKIVNIGLRNTQLILIFLTLGFGAALADSLTDALVCIALLIDVTPLVLSSTAIG